ncbi:MAG: hypothetical protein ETSY1_34395 [Candidatus Entotheonella factor]|uniref:Uncharacterized protein n=1 Tax=Entotheonella factor TaxID=1429438 RepID=W4L8W8_ENTF1|nr:MAG: hypothetical protein ETSY1_34395 [Candidatus Entotheonella factor]
MENENLVSALKEAEVRVKELSKYLQHSIQGILCTIHSVIGDENLDNDIDNKDSDFNNKNEVYQTICNFIEETYNQSKAVSISATHIICKESDPSFLKNDISKDDSNLRNFISFLESQIIMIKVRYEPFDEGIKKYKRITEINFISDDNRPKVRTVELELNWFDLPPDVRSARLSRAEKTVTFTLFP